MNHADAFEERAVRFADGEIDGTEALEFESHMKECPACAEAVGQHRDALRLVRTGTSAVPAAGALAPETVRQRATTRRSLRYSAAGASGLVVLAATLATLREPAVESPMAVQSDIEADLELRLLEHRIAVLEAQLEQMRAETKRISEWAAMQAELSDREIAAIALAAAQHLEDSGLDVDGARRQYQMVIDHFANTPEANVARERLAAT